MRVKPIRKAELLATLPAEWPGIDLRDRIREATVASGRRVVVLDDDPTGTQTVHSLPVVTGWEPETLVAAWDESETAFYVLTNSRRYPLEEAAAMNRHIARNLAQVTRERNVEPVVVSRSDSTLRGHYPGEVSALRGALEAELGIGYDGIVVVPFFLEGGRFTINDVHWVQEGEWLTPAAQTEFAQDPTFGYRHSDLREWVAEKTRGEVEAEAVVSVGLEAVREGGSDAITDLLSRVAGRRVVVVNAATYRDLEVFVWGMMQAERQGKRFLFRSAASFVKVRGGVPDRGLLRYSELYPMGREDEIGGLTVAGSYVQRTTEQLNQVLKQDGMLGVELHVVQVLADKRHPNGEGRAREISRVLERIGEGLRHGRDVVLYTTRELVVPAGAPQLSVAQQVSGALVEIVRRLSLAPSYLIAKGGITSSDVATDGLGVRKAQVLGQIVPGVPVLRLGPESKYPGLPYVVFPGNVGGPDALVRTVQILRGAEVS